MSRNSTIPQRLPPALIRFAAALIALLLTCGLAEFICRKLIHLNVDPYSYPLGRGYYPDFLRFQEQFRHFHSVEFFTYPSGSAFRYPAPAAVVYKIFFSARHALGAFLGFFIVCVAAAGTQYGRVLHRRGIDPVHAYLFSFAVLLASYPLWCDFKQGNIEIVVCLLATLGIVGFVSGHDYVAALCFGVAGGIKIYPLMLLGLLLARKQFRQITVALSVLVLSTLASLWLVCPSIPTSWQYISAGVKSFRPLYMLTLRPEIGTDHSLFAIEKLILRPLPPPPLLSHYLTFYMAALAISGTALFCFRIWKLPLINQVLCLTCASVLFPPVSYEYTLIELFAPLGLVLLLTVDAYRLRHRVPGLHAVLGCFVVLLAPLPELIWRRQTVDGQVKCIALVVLFTVALWRPLEITDRLVSNGNKGGDLAPVSKLA